MKDIAGKIALITGAASGIGLAIATSLAKAGATLILTDIDQDKLDAAAADLSKLTTVATERFDVAIQEAWAESASRIEARFGGLDILVNNAGVGSAKQPLEQISQHDWDWIFSINVHGVRNGLCAWLPRMRARGSQAHVVNTASILGHFALPTASDYVATKFAVVGMTEALRLELQGTPIGLSLLCPGLVATPLSQSRDERARRDRGEAPAEQPLLRRGIEVQRVGEDVLAAIRANTFYVFTHAEYQDVIDRRSADIHADFSKARLTGEDVRMLAGSFLDLSRS
jgi:NADP-dependent 3-hydroxy acid dehydrogenase YdfG